MMYAHEYNYQIDLWFNDGCREKWIAGVEDLDIAFTAFALACEKYQGRHVTLSQGARLIRVQEPG